MAKTSKIAKAPKSFKSYALNKCLIGYGVVNGIINAAIFAGINAGAPDAMFGMHDIVRRAVPFRSSPRPTRSPFSAWARSPRWSGPVPAPFFPWHCRPPALP